MKEPACHRSYLDTLATRLLDRFPPPRRALFLDRDGVINVDRGYVHNPEDVEWMSGIFELCQAAQLAGFLSIVVTNQAGIARGFYSEAGFLEFTQWMHGEFRRRGAPLLATYYCPHHPSEGRGSLLMACECRKPAPGMLLAASRDLDLDLAGSVLIGDSASDIGAAEAAGVGKSWLLEGGILPVFDALAEAG